MAFGWWSVGSLKAGERTGLNAELTENAEDAEGARRGWDSAYTGEDSMGVTTG
jgi:hypothetical protein